MHQYYSQEVQGKFEMASQTAFINEHEQAMRQLAAESLLLLSTQNENTATWLPDRDDFWAMVMGGRPSLPEPPSLPDSGARLPQVKNEAQDEHLPKEPRRNPPRAAKTQEPVLVDTSPELLQQQQVEEAALDEDVAKRRRRNPPRAAKTQQPPLTDTCPDSLQRVEDETPGTRAPERPRRNPRRATKPQECEVCPSLPEARPKRPAEDEAPDGHDPKRSRLDTPTTPIEAEPQESGECPYEKPLPTRELIIEAILSAPDKKMSIPDIKRYLQSNYPWFTWGYASRFMAKIIRTALGRRKVAFKILEEVPGQRGYWRVTAKYLDHLRRLRSFLE